MDCNYKNVRSIQHKQTISEKRSKITVQEKRSLEITKQIKAT